ncbi:MAG: hypothetical protein Q9227_002709 [Pyrenula ochraceoflavens]
MAPALPVGFVDLPRAHGLWEQKVNIIGIVVDIFAPSKTRGRTDWMVTFTLQDSYWRESPHMSGEGLSCRFFTQENCLPLIKSTGDVVVLQNIKIKEWNGVRIALSTRGTLWHVLSREEKFIPKSLPNTRPLSKDQLSYAIQIGGGEDLAALMAQDTISTRTPAVPLKPTNSSPPTSAWVNTSQNQHREKFSLLQDLYLPSGGQLCFKDLMGEVRKIYPDGSKTQLYVTDYTSNKKLYDYSHGCDGEGREGDQFSYIPTSSSKWPGPWGKMTLQITVWGSQSYFVNSKVNVGDYVSLQNVHIKCSPYGLIEGALRDDPKFPEKLLVVCLQPRIHAPDERLKNLLKRRKVYESTARRHRHAIPKDEPTTRHKRPIQDAEEEKENITVEEIQKPMNKKQRKKEKRKQKKLAEQQSANPENISSNSHVTTNNVDIPCTPLSTILDPSFLLGTTPKGTEFSAPFDNCCYRLKIRVIDFLPDHLEDLCQPYIESDYDYISSDSDSGSSSSSSSSSSSYSALPNDIDSITHNKRWEWRFALLVEDATPQPKTSNKERIILYVAQGDGDYLLNMEAEDLRRKPQALTQLREKLFVLWGDLEEQKRERDREQDPAAAGDDLGMKLTQRPLEVKSRAFECLVKEFGIRKRGVSDEKDPTKLWERRFRLYGTRIM